jgi:hypothetical protein
MDRPQAVQSADQSREDMQMKFAQFADRRVLLAVSPKRKKNIVFDAFFRRFAIVAMSSDYRRVLPSQGTRGGSVH